MVFDTRTNNIGYSAEEMIAGGVELATSDKAAIFAEPLLDALMMEDSESDGCLPDPASTNESDGRKAFCQTDNLLYQIFASKADPWR